jgi:histidinol phosphatase-like enzyme
MTKLIFLDFDGVLNSQLWYVRTKGSREQDDLDTEAIGFLNTLIKKTGAKVVVSSTWRIGRTVDELQEILNRNGFTGEVLDKTKDLRIGEDGDCILRGNEILQWIKSHPEHVNVGYWDYKNYVIFDDDTDMLYWQRNNFIKTNPYVGLTPSDIYNAEKILNA